MKNDGTCAAAGDLFGGFITETFQVLDRYLNAFNQSGLTVQENLSNWTVYLAGSPPQSYPTTGQWTTTVRGSQSKTNSQGLFLDTPFGGCGPISQTDTFTQQYRVMYNGQPIVIASLNVTMVEALGALSIKTQYYQFVAVLP